MPTMRAGPSMTRALGLMRSGEPASFTSFSNSLMFSMSLSLSLFLSNSSSSSAVMMICSIYSSGWRRRQATAMLMAVSTLSPVRTQILMPALARSAMQAGTPSCSLSSMAEAPRSLRSFSRSSARRSILLLFPMSLFSISVKFALAALKSLCHFSNQSLSSVLLQIMSVRSPSLAYSVMCSQVEPRSFSWLPLSLGIMTVSAPLLYNSMTSSFLTTTLIRLRVLLNSIISKIW
mmetsp:Transcript_6534/g.12569  ORF Transcript_6534/g.12569 Transcript_6534/m.12569 type:complete len:233 (+) Transcript_6534:1692-2390(+)